MLYCQESSYDRFYTRPIAPIFARRKADKNRRAGEDKSR